MALKTRMARSIRLILDFDGTITKKDTLHLVAKVGYDKQKAVLSPIPPNPWEEIVNAYLKDFSNHQSDYRPKKEDRNTLDEEIKWLNSLKPIETASAARFQDAGIFNGVMRTHLIEAASRAFQHNDVEIRPGLYQLLRRVYRHNVSLARNDQFEKLQVLSVNWSRQFIWGVIEAGARLYSDSETEQNMGTLLRAMSVYANEAQSVINEDGYESVPPRGNAVSLRTSGDKLQQMLHHKDTDQRPLTIYVGDSATDLECLMAADVGICIRDEPMGSGQAELAEICTRLNISVIHIASHQNSIDQAEDGLPKTRSRLCWAKNFTDIDQWFSGSIRI